MPEVLVIKTAALGDVLRTTSILPGLAAAIPGVRITWVTAPGARELVSRHRLVDEVVAIDPRSDASVDAWLARLEGRRFAWTISLDDEPALCRLASRVPSDRLSGATFDAGGERVYTDDVEPWFGMGLLSRAGREAADRRKIENRRTHPEILAGMLGLATGKPELPLAPDAIGVAGRLFASWDGDRDRELGPWIGLNTGAGSRWKTKELLIDELVALVAALARGEGGVARPRFLLLGGRDEAERNAEIVRRLAALTPRPEVHDAGSENSLSQFAAIVARLDLLLTSDSLALHVAVARDVPLVAFFAPTSAAEIELYGLGEKVWSTAPDYCSYRVDADNSSITAARLLPALRRTFERFPPRER
jgi:heptosyltransferase-2